MKNNDGYVKATLENINEKIKTFVTHDEFAPVKIIAYGIAGSILMGAMGVIVSLIFVKK